MALWIILVLGWILVLALALSLVRLAGYTEKKIRNRVQQRPRGRDDQAA